MLEILGSAISAFEDLEYKLWAVQAPKEKVSAQ